MTTRDDLERKLKAVLLSGIETTDTRKRNAAIKQITKAINGIDAILADAEAVKLLVTEESLGTLQGVKRKMEISVRW